MSPGDTGAQKNSGLVDIYYRCSNHGFMTRKHLDVGPLEMDVLGALNAGGEQSVADIRNVLKASGRSLAYTTVMTVLVRLHKKGLVLRQKQGRQFLYSAATKKESSSLRIFERVKNSLFGSERLAPILSLLNAEQDLSREELQELKRAIEARIGRDTEKL